MGLVYKKIGNDCFVRLFKQINYDVPILIFFPSGASKPNTNPNGDSKPMNSVLNAAQSAQRREGI